MTYRDDVRRHYLHDPLCSDEYYGHLMQQADEADQAAENEAERLDAEEELILGSLDNESDQVYGGGMTDFNPLGLTVEITLGNLLELAAETKKWSDDCFDTEVELAHAENTIRQLRSDLAFADSSAAVDKNGAVRIVDELCADRAGLQLAVKGLSDEINDLEARLASAEHRVELYHDDRDVWQDEAVKAEANLDEAYVLIREKDVLIRTLQEDLTAERSALARITSVVTGNYDPTRMLFEIRRALEIA